ncbi:MAG TPA: hypothetical protein VN213_03600 [Solirubrobacteraceae bacterium]|nr:hypothetical protein [Solirubrobacteraceae bacterium]
MRRPNAANVRRIAAVIRDPEEHTVFDARGAVRSIQAADLTMTAEDLEALWTPMNLERLARTYWKYLSRVSLGLFRVVYTPTERVVVLLARPFVLLRFHPPDYAVEPDRGIVRWRIRDGLLVAQEGHDADGYLEIDVRRCEADAPGQARVHVEVEIASFYPAIAFRIARWFYANTQSRIHVLVTHGFLRSLARRDLEESAVGRFAEPGRGNGAAPQPTAGARPVNVGDTPWAVVGALVACVAVAIVLALRRR